MKEVIAILVLLSVVTQAMAASRGKNATDGSDAVSVGASTAESMLSTYSVS